MCYIPVSKDSQPDLPMIFPGKKVETNLETIIILPSATRNLFVKRFLDLQKLLFRVFFIIGNFSGDSKGNWGLSPRRFFSFICPAIIMS